MNLSTYEAAMTYHQRDWHVIALHRLTDAGACACQRGTACRSAGKHPVETSWQEGERPSAADLVTLFAEGEANIGLATGQRSGFWVLDVDPDHGGDKTLAADRKSVV